MTTKLIFDIKDEDVYWCTADIGWITGHSYIVYGPLAIGATTIMFEGVPNYPNPDRFWNVVAKYKVNVFYTAPTAIRAIARDGEEWPAKNDLSSLRLLGSVGEPINPEAWMWYYTQHRQGTLPHRRHMVADRDGRHPHHAASRRLPAEAGLRDASLPGHFPGGRSRGRKAVRAERRRLPR